MITEATSTRQTANGDASLKLTGLRKINVLFGKNGTGKSSFIRNLYQADAETYHLIIPERGGETTHQSQYADQEFDTNAKKEVRKHNFDNNYRTRAISSAPTILTNKGYKFHKGISGGGVNSAEITNLFRIFLPEFRIDFSSNPPHRLEIYRIVDEREDLVSTVTQLSSGQSEAISLAADIITRSFLWADQEKVLLIDEPDAHLHMDLQNRFSILISEIVSKFNIQVVIATHSQSLIASLLSVSDDVAIFCLDPQKTEITAVKKDRNTIFSNLLSVDLALAVILKRKIVIVEGNDDYLVWNQACRAPEFPDCVILQANGSDIKKYKQNAEQLLSAILDITALSGITLLDKDNRGSAANPPNALLPYHRLKCYSLENLLMTNEILEYMSPNVSLAGELTDLKEELAVNDKTIIDSIIQNKKGTKISKELIKKIHNKIDPHQISRDWRIVLGSFIGKQKPTGELAQYLNEEVINYLWPDDENTD